MLDKKFGFLVVIFFLAATIIIPTVSTDVASAQCSWVSCLTIVKMLDSQTDYRWMGDWDPRFDSDMQTHYCGVNRNDCDVRCELEYGCQTCRPR
jgi:hypothetical protein